MDMATVTVMVTAGMVIMGRGGVTATVIGVAAGIRVSECMSPQVMGITLIRTNASPQGMAGIHAHTMSTATRVEV
jgi:hypothetical protein